MDLHYAPEDLAFRQATRRWFQANTPRVEPKTLDERKAWHRTMYDAGYVGMLWPREYGGRGALARAISSCAIACCIGVAPRPPYSVGHSIPT